MRRKFCTSIGTNEAMRFSRLRPPFWRGVVWEEDGQYAFKVRGETRMSDSDYGRRMKEGLAGLFGRAAESYDSLGPRAFSYWGRRLVEWANIPRGANVLDVGTGRGEELFPATERVGRTGYVIGIDFAVPMVRLTVEEIRQRGLRNAEAYLMDAEALAFADASFDYVLSSSVLNLCPSPDRALAEMARVLRPEGKVAVIPTGGGAGGLIPSRGAGGVVGAFGGIGWFAELLRAYVPQSQGLQRREQDLQARRSYRQETGQSWPIAGYPAGFEEALRQAGFVDIQIVPEEAEFVFADEKEWWAWQWSNWMREVLERMEPETLERFKADVFEKLRSLKEPDGLHARGRTVLAMATKRRG